MKRALLWHASEADHAPPTDLQDVAAHVQLLSLGGLHEGAVRTLIDQCELNATDLDAGVQARDHVALDHDVVFLGATNGDARLALIHQQLAIIEPQPQTHAACRGRIACEPEQ